MKTNNLTKILALVLTVSVFFVSVGIHAGITSVASENLAPEVKSVVKGNQLLPTSLKDYETVVNLGDANRLDLNPDVSIVREGVANTYALKLSGNDASDAKKAGYIKLGGETNTIRPNVDYTISMKVKKAGTVNSFNSGINTAWTLKKGTAFTNSDIKEDEWTTWTFTVRPELNSNNVTGWCHVYLNWDIPKDSYLLIDDISVKAVDDNYEVLPRGTFDQNVYVELNMNNDSADGVTYYKNEAILTGMSQLPEVGFKGSYGAKLDTINTVDTALSSGTRAKIRFQNTSGLEKYTDYCIEFKLRKTGDITAFQARVQERWNNQHIFMLSTPELVNTYLSSEWSHFIVNFKSSHDVDGAFSYVTFQAHGDTDAEVFIDEIRVYKANDASKTNLLYNGDFDTARIVAGDKAEWVDVQGAISEFEYDAVINFGENSRISNRADAEITKTGIDGSYGLQLSGAGATGKNVILTFGNHTNCLERGVTYVFEVTAKAPGGINNLRFGLRGGALAKENYGSWKVNKAVGSEIVVADWKTYTQEIDHTYTGTGTEPKDVWEGFRIEWKSPEGADVFIDNIKVYRKDDPNKTNIFPNGTFDGGVHQESPADEEVLKNAYFSPNGLISDKDGSYNISEYDCIPNFGVAAHLPQNANASIVKVGVDGSFALALKGNGAAQGAAITIGTQTNVLTRGTAYVLSMKVKKTGTVNSMSFGIKYDWEAHDTAITPTDDWATYTAVITPSTEKTDQSWYHIELDWNAASDAVIYIDDISVTVKETGEEKFPEGTFDNPKNVGANGSYKIEEFDCIPNFGDSLHLPKNPNASVEKVGIDGGFALRLKGNGALQQGNITIGTGTNILKRGTTYVVSMKVKKIGTITEFTAGITYDWKYYPNTIVATDSFETYTFEITPSTENTGNSWYHLAVNWNAPVGSELIIDDISIVARDSTVNLFPEGVFDNPANRGLSQNVLLAKGEGVRGSIGGKLAGTGSENTAEYIFEYADMLENNTEYYIEFKAKRFGKITSFGVGIMEAKDARFAVDWKGADILNERFSDVFYNKYRVKYTTADECDDGFASSVVFKYNAPAGAYILIDDVRVYKVNDAGETDILRFGSADYTYYDLEFDNKDEGLTYVAKDISLYTSKHRFYVTDKTKLNASLSIAEKEGVKGSAAFKLAGNGETQTFKYTMQNLSELVNNCKYKIGLKVKVVADDGVDLSKFDSFFKFGIAENDAKNYHYIYNFSGNDFGTRLTDNYHYYQAEYTTDGNCWKVWSFLTFSYALPEGAALYIDDLEFIPVSEEAKWITDIEGNAVNIVNNGSFDSIDKGQTPTKFYTGEVKDENPVCEYYANSSGAEPRALVGAITGHYALAFGFKEQDVSGGFSAFITPSMPGESYKVSFYVKVVGDITDATFFMSDGYWLHHSTGLNFDQYEEGKWTKYEIIFHDKSHPSTIETYRRLYFNFNGPAGSGMLVDNITCTRVVEEGKALSFNVLGSKGDFEESTTHPAIDWLANNRFNANKEDN